MASKSFTRYARMEEDVMEKFLKWFAIAACVAVLVAIPVFSVKLGAFAAGYSVGHEVASGRNPAVLPPPESIPEFAEDWYEAGFEAGYTQSIMAVPQDDKITPEKQK